MSSYREDRERYVMLAKVILVVAVIGIVALIYANIGNDPSHVAFSLIAFVVSVAALLMTMLQNLTITRQLRATERTTRLLHETIEGVGSLTRADRKLGQEVRADIKLDHEIVALLEQSGVFANEHERKKVARRIVDHVDKHHNSSRQDKEVV